MKTKLKAGAFLAFINTLGALLSACESPATQQAAGNARITPGTTAVRVATEVSPIPVAKAVFDSNPNALVLYADIHYSGVPLPTRTPNDRYCDFLPSLRVWGDGYAYLDENVRNERAAVLSGQLDPATVRALLDILNSEGFFTTWQVPGPANPSGALLRMGAQLQGRPKTEYSTGNLGPPMYQRLIEAVRVKVKPATEQNNIDGRVDKILIADENCNKYMFTSPTPAEAPGALTPPTASLRFCHALDLDAAWGRQLAATGGELTAYIVLANHSHTVCALRGVPDIQLIDAGNSPVAVDTRKAHNCLPFKSCPPDQVVELQPGLEKLDPLHPVHGQAWLKVWWNILEANVKGCPSQGVVKQVMMTLPDSGDKLSVDLTTEGAQYLSMACNMQVQQFEAVD